MTVGYYCIPYYDVIDTPRFPMDDADGGGFCPHRTYQTSMPESNIAGFLLLNGAIDWAKRIMRRQQNSPSVFERDSHRHFNRGSPRNLAELLMCTTPVATIGNIICVVGQRPDEKA